MKTISALACRPFRKHTWHTTPCNFTLQLCNDHWRKCFAIVHLRYNKEARTHTHFTTICNIILESYMQQRMGTTHTYNKNSTSKNTNSYIQHHVAAKKHGSVRLRIVHTMLRKAIIKSDRPIDLRSSDWTEETNKWMRYHVMLTHTCSTK